MPNLAATLREEIRRLAKKEIKIETSATKQAIVQYRHEIAALKRQLREQEKKIHLLQKRDKKRSKEPEKEVGDKVRFSARSVKAQRKRLGLSAANYARLVGVSPLTIFNWEHGKSRPRQEQLAALVAVRGIGKREATKRLEMLEE